MTATVTTLQEALKTLYPQDMLETTYLEECPLLAILDKSDDWQGNPMRIAMEIGAAPGSHTFSAAQSVSGYPTNIGMDLTWVRDYTVVRITTEAIRASRGDAGSLVRGIKQQVDSALYTQKKSLGLDIYRSGTGSRGRIASGADSTTLTLTDPNDAFNFEVGDVLVSNNVDSSAGISANTGTVGGIDYDAGTLTVLGGGNWHADFDTSDYLFRSGDASAALSGLAAWLPTTAPSATPFFGLDRTQSSRLSGVRYAYTVAADGTMERYIVNFATRVCRLGGKPNVCVMNPLRWGNLVNELGDKCRYDRLMGKKGDGSEASFGFEVISIMGPKGMIKVLADPYCPYDNLYLLDTSKWKFKTLGPMGWIHEAGTAQWLTMASADSYEARLGWYGQLYSTFPGSSGTGDISALA